MRKKTFSIQNITMLSDDNMMVFERVKNDTYGNPRYDVYVINENNHNYCWKYEKVQAFGIDDLKNKVLRLLEVQNEQKY